MALERIQKIIARSGMCSRRDADILIQQGRVTVNGKVAEAGERAEAERDHVKVDGKALKRPEPKRYLLLYKPTAVVTTCDDPEGRTTVVDLLRGAVRERVFPVGRLDYHSEGLLILTNDGDLAAAISHPRFGVVRQYLAKIRGDLTAEQRAKLMRGTTIDGHRVKPHSLHRVRVTREAGNSWWQIEVTEGRTHEVRELFFRSGHHVQRLQRTAIGPVRDDTLAPGELRFLTADEVAALQAACEGRKPRRKAPQRAKRPSRKRSPGPA